MTTKTTTAEVLRRARLARKRLDLIIAALEDEDVYARDVARRVSAFYQAAYGDRRTLRWRAFVEAIEQVTRRAKPHDSARVVAERVIATYGEVCPDLAPRLDVARVRDVIDAWQNNRRWWPDVHAALVGVVPDLPAEGSIRKMWSRHSLRMPWRVPSKDRRPARRRRKS